MRKIFGLMLVAVLGGCGDDKGTTDGGTDGSGGSTSGTPTTGTPTTGVSVTGMTTDPSGTMGGSATMGDTTGVTSDPVTTTEPGTTTEPATTGEPGSTGEPGTSGGSTGGGGVDIPADCEAVCGAADMCGFPAGPDCVMGCVGDLGGSMGECAQAVDAFLMCLAGMSCMDLADFFQNQNPGPCTNEAGQAGLVCDMGMPGECVESVGGNPNACSYSKECPNMPPVEMMCNKNSCTCLVDGMEVGTCMSDAICQTQDQLPMKAADCCGF